MSTSRIKQGVKNLLSELKIGKDFNNSFSTSNELLSLFYVVLGEIGEKLTWTEPWVVELSDLFNKNTLSEGLFN